MLLMRKMHLRLLAACDSLYLCEVSDNSQQFKWASNV